MKPMNLTSKPLKAKSRLAHSEPAILQTSRRAKPQADWQKMATHFVGQYLRHWPTAVLAVGMWICLWQLIISLPPGSMLLKLIPIEFVWLGLIWLGTFFSFSFLTLNRYFGFWVSWAIFGILGLKMMLLMPFDLLAGIWLGLCGIGLGGSIINQKKY